MAEASELTCLQHHRLSALPSGAEAAGSQWCCCISHYLLVGQILAAFAVDLPEGAIPEIPE
jgi:hypothetical protein